jgi:hypothetical protein
MKIVSAIIATAILFSCKNNNQVAVNSGSSGNTGNTSGTSAPALSPDTTTTSTVKNDVLKKTDSTTTIADAELCRLMISFFSIGSGSEYKLIAELEDTIASYSDRTGKKIDFVVTPWGREGEKDFSFKLKELTREEQADFINRVKQITQKGKWVHLYENHPCSTRGRK